MAPAAEANHDLAANAVDSGEPAPTSLSECDSLHAEHEDASLTAPEIGKTIGLDVEDRVARDEGSHHVANGVQLSGDVALIAETVVPSPATSRDRDVSSAAPEAAAVNADSETLGGVGQQMHRAPAAAAQSDEDEAEQQVGERGEAAELSISDKEEDANDSSAEGGEDAAKVELGGGKASNSNFRALLEADAARAKEMKQVSDCVSASACWVSRLDLTPRRRSFADAQDWPARACRAEARNPASCRRSHP